MNTLLIHLPSGDITASFVAPAKLADVLESVGVSVAHPCGGNGLCGKCKVKIEGQLSAPTPIEQAAGSRLSCQVVLEGDAEVVITKVKPAVIQTEGAADLSSIQTKQRAAVGAAVDIGTTTVALRVYDLADGRLIDQAADINPQVAVAADVMGRIGAAVEKGAAHQQALIRNKIESLLGDHAPETLVVTGNTAMLYLYTGRDPETLSHAPFEADCLFDTEDGAAYLPPCMNAFVGADITCAVLASGMCDKDKTALLCDIGTNGEIALWHKGVLYVTSTAAGPAFEGAGISCGMGAVPGAIDKVWAEGDNIRVHTIGDVEATGVCGSGLIDAVAAFLETELVEDSGYTDVDELTLTDHVALLPKDIRAVQLAKAAIAAGIGTLLEWAGIDADDIADFYIAGGFGSHLDPMSAAKIGLIPEELVPKAKVIGNAALDGAAMLLLDPENRDQVRRIAHISQHVNLGGNKTFNEKYTDAMFFPEQD